MILHMFKARITSRLMDLFSS